MACEHTTHLLTTGSCQAMQAQAESDPEHFKRRSLAGPGAPAGLAGCLASLGESGSGGLVCTQGLHS